MNALIRNFEYIYRQNLLYGEFFYRKIILVKQITNFITFT